MVLISFSGKLLLPVACILHSLVMEAAVNAQPGTTPAPSMRGTYYADWLAMQSYPPPPGKDSCMFLKTIVVHFGIKSR
jgi:hypothetical protein